MARLAIRRINIQLSPCLNLKNQKRYLFTVPKGPIEYTHRVLIREEPTKVYNIVSEVSKYKEFIPYCLDSFVDKRDSNNDNKPIQAGLRVGFRQYDERFVCNVDCSNNVIGRRTKYVVKAESISHQLFKELSGTWIITPCVRNKNISTVELLLRFQFHSKLYNAVSTIFAHSATTLVMKAFATRAEQLKIIDDEKK
ncbi:hypothetical protein TBLA_0E03110 [Henningerozyma blattae CBS 6284]|uniref:Coenzyme Q-binding protein COQ10 START domain-containing protein n=1 Tax=Henningerozyma blattae (strain ATCC 34711 / CBS 6284 / DSM 70876 / NBRC 10599 / NRRL Y-10934 / UCD 77-7) TaxID=1071380 RepID=I2H4R3_HENB6|nr:hypothetical protein TBLA_0E03110 [Tetrapisispora blattae CBS 6284]CCH61365.1 hypothetical protein TBLA_0E03110 [Tetrapisispora blattae CBS 6284]